MFTQRIGSYGAVMTRSNGAERGRVRLFGVAALLGLSVGGCLGSASDGPNGVDEGGADGGEATGGASVGTGGATSGGPVTGGAASGGTTATMTETEWKAATAPVSAPHEIWTYDTCEVPHAGSESTRIGQEYSIIPPIGYIDRPRFENGSPIYFDAVLVPFCVTSADCTEQPGGLCQGTIADAYCDYPEPPTRDVCDEDADCIAGLDGTCVPPEGVAGSVRCDPTGACEEVSGECKYAGDAPCSSDADCNEAPGGDCIFPVVEPLCRYGACTSDDDCTDGERCGCGFCVSAACASDESCPDGETCELSNGGCTSGFHCSTPDDSCTAGEPGCYFNDLSQDDAAWGPDICLLK